MGRIERVRADEEVSVEKARGCSLTMRLEVYDAMRSPGTRPCWRKAETTSATRE